MSKNGEQQALVPRLRFPGFREEPAWSSSRLGDFATIVKGKGISKADITSDGALPAIRYAELYTVYDEVIREVVSRTNLDADDLVLSQQEDVIIPASGETKADIATAASVAIAGVALGSDLNVIRSHLHGPFFSYYLNSSKRADIAKVAQGDTVAHLYPGQLEKIIVDYPSPAEQQKIADCLGSLDDLITAEGRKLATLRDHKKGLMQQLFPREGETRPRLRFPEFRDAPEWQPTTIGEHVNLLSGFPFDGKDIVEDSTGVPLMRGINITEGQIRHDPDYDRFYLGPTEGLEKYRLLEGDLVIGMDGSKVGKNAALISSVDAGALLVQRVARLRSDREVLMRFIFHIVVSPKFHSYVDRINTSSGIPHISAKQIKEFSLTLPSDEEQQRIANCLSSLDTLIVAQAEKLDALRTHKRGLMQQLFPIPEA